MRETDAISRSAAISDLREWLYGSPDDEFQEGFDSALLGAINRLLNENINPALDVAPVVHARWRYKVAYAVNARVTNIIYCTACGKGFHRIEGVNFNFCPNCGARMDGEADG